MKATREWMAACGADYLPGAGRTGTAHLRHYAARYSVWGEGPPLVLVPGLAGGLELLGPLARHLAKDFQVIAYQLRGEDDWSALRQPFGLADLARDLGELLDWFGLESPALMGVSFGGVVALELLARQPWRARSLVLQGVGPRFESGLLQRVAGMVLTRYPLPCDNPFVNQFFNLFFGRRQQPGPLFDFVTRQCWQTDQGVMAHRFRMVEEVEMTGRLSAVRAPALLLGGGRDLLVSSKGLQDLAAELPAGRAKAIPGCGHLAFVTHSEKVAAEARQFLLN